MFRGSGEREERRGTEREAEAFARGIQRHRLIYRARTGAGSRYFSRMPAEERGRPLFSGDCGDDATGTGRGTRGPRRLTLIGEKRMNRVGRTVDNRYPLNASRFSAWNPAA